MKWLQQGSDGKNPHTPEAVDPIVAETLKWLKSEKGATRIGASGYCFGAKVCRPCPFIYNTGTLGSRLLPRAHIAESPSPQEPAS